MSLLKKPVFYFVLQVLGLAMALAFLGWFGPVSVGDTSDYVEFPFGSFTEALRHPRTFGYPLFLQTGGILTPSYGAIPLLGLIVHVLSVYVFWRGLNRVFQSEWTSMLTASSLLYSNILFRYGNNLAADRLASSLAIATLGWLFLALFNDRRRYDYWCLLALGIFMTYQVRPAYLFLIPLMPTLGISLYWLVTPASTHRRAWWALTLGLILVVAVPYLAYCSVRWAAVGSFSLVSFGGNNAAAVTCMFLSEDDVKTLPSDVQPLAGAVMERRKGVAEKDTGYTAGATRRYMEIETPFDVNLCDVCIPAAKEVHGDDWPKVNRSLWRLASTIVAEKSNYYAVWLAKAFIRGVYMIVSEYIMNPVCFLLLFALAATHACSVVLRKRAGPISSDVEPAFFIEINTLWVLALSFALASLLLVILTSPALGRFMDAAGVFLACVLARTLVNRIELCRRLIRP